MDKNLQTLKDNNDVIEIVEETDHINISKLWNDNTFMCRLEKKTDFQPLTTLAFPTELSAIYHKDTSRLEYIFTPLHKDDILISRKFTILLSGAEFKCSFQKPTNAFKLIATGFRDTEPSSDSDHRNLSRFRDFYKQDDLPHFIKKYFEDRTPVNFFVEGDFNKINFDFVSLSKQLNFFMSYYDRETPRLVILEQTVEDKKYNEPCYTKRCGFPEIINIRPFDPVILDLFNVAMRTSNIRLKFIFYFQVLEYCSYYHLNEDLKKRLSNIIKRPDLLNNTNDYSKLLIEEFKDHFKQNDDSLKLEKLIIDQCTWEDVRLEIETHKEYFSKELKFDGDFKINALISEKEDFDAPHPSIMKSIKTNIEKIRNVLVHIRESRENKVILPTTKNNNLLIPYLHLVQRLAEKIAIQYN